MFNPRPFCTINCFIMANVTLAACKIANILFGMPRWETVLICGLLNVVFAAYSGLWGVLVIDMIQFIIKMTAVIAAAYFALVAVADHTHAGKGALAGLHQLVSTLGAQQVNEGANGQPVLSPVDGKGQALLDVMPNFSLKLALTIFIVPIAIGWWANWYPGAEPGGGSYIAQRMLASKSEKDSLGGVLFFNFAHYVLRPWPWIITGLCSIIIFPQLKDIQAAFPKADPLLIGHDSAFPAMLKFLPVGFVGLMVGGLIAANSSTILTHLNWGSSYLVHDFYRRFVRPDREDKHYVNAGRLCTICLYIVAAALSWGLSSAQAAFEILIGIGAGTGLLYILRWFWWRINAWCEVAAMAGSFLISVAFFVVKKSGHEVPFAESIIYSAAFTTLCWVPVAMFGPRTSREQLERFYRKVHPAGPGWSRIRREAGVTQAEAALHGDHMGLALLGWVSGCAAIWSSLFAIGNFLYGRTNYAYPLLAVFVISAIALIYVVNKLWRAMPQRADPDGKPSVATGSTPA